MTPAQTKVLEYLKRDPGANSRTVAEVLYRYPKYKFGEHIVSKLMTILEKNGYIDGHNNPTNKVV